MLLSSKGVPIEMVEKHSNGNVETIIAEAHTLGTAIILIYNPPSNFALEKFKESLGRINRYLEKNAAKEKPMEIILTGDLNFPSTVTTWDQSDVGVIPNPKGGKTDRKIGFQMLSELTENHNLTQLVNKVTHEKEILDLVFTSNPIAFSSCQTDVIAPESDHHLVKFEITTNL